MTDPIVAVLGKDIASLIAKSVHQMRLQTVHDEYFSFILRVCKNGRLVFHEPQTSRQEFMFNFRFFQSFNGISRWHGRKYREPQAIHLHDVSLPRNYWGTEIIEQNESSETSDAEEAE